MPMPYGYFKLIRVVATVVFAYMTYQYFFQKQQALFLVSIILVILFQPLIKIHLGREMWNMVDIGVAGFLLFLAIKDKRLKKQ